MSPGEVERQAIRLLSHALYSGLHRLKGDPNLEADIRRAEQAVAFVQAALKGDGRASTRATRRLAARALAEAFAPLAAKGFEIETLYMRATIAAVPEARPKRRGVPTGDVLRTALALFVERMIAELDRAARASRGQRRGELSEYEASRLSAETARGMFESVRSIVWKWDARGALAEIACLTRIRWRGRQDAKAAFERIVAALSALSD